MREREADAQRPARRPCNLVERIEDLPRDDARRRRRPALEHVLHDERAAVLLDDRRPLPGAEVGKALEKGRRVGRRQDAVDDVHARLGREDVRVREEPVARREGQRDGARASRDGSEREGEKDALGDDLVLGRQAAAVEELLHDVASERVEAELEEVAGERVLERLCERRVARLEAARDEEVACRRGESNSAE